MRYTRYVDTLGKVELPYEVGICDRINSCGYKYSVKEYLKDHPAGLDGEAGRGIQPWTGPRPRREPSYHSRQLMERTCSPLHYRRNPLYRYLTSLWTEEEVDEVMDRYRVGTSSRWDGAAVFWQIDTSGRVRGGKIMGYDPDTGRRIKSPKSQVTWVHSAMGMTDFNMGQCLFGSHLACDPADGRRIWIVESEKTAIIGSLYYDDALFLATGGLHGISESMDMEALRGREVVLMPDVGGRSEWRRMAVHIAKIADKVYMSPFLSDKENDPAWLGKDIADYIVEQLAEE